MLVDRLAILASHLQMTLLLLQLIAPTKKTDTLLHNRGSGRQGNSIRFLIFYQTSRMMYFKIVPDKESAEEHFLPR